MRLPRPRPGTGRWWAVGIVGCAAAVAVIVWIAIVSTVGAVTFTTVSYRVLGDSAVEVDFDVHRDPGVAATCTVEAMAQDFSVVGTIDVPIPASEERSVSQTATVRTASLAVTGVVSSCRADG